MDFCHWFVDIMNLSTIIEQTMQSLTDTIASATNAKATRFPGACVICKELMNVLFSKVLCLYLRMYWGPDFHVFSRV